MKNKEKETSGEEGWTIVKNKKAASAGKSRSVLNKNGFCCWIEAKGFSITKGFGSKSGKIQIIESKGERFSTLWVNYKGLDWFRKGLMLEITKSWSKSQSWHFNDSDEWLSATRGRNNNGEFIKLSGPNSWGNTVDLYFPSGSNGEGWKNFLTLINQLIKPIESQTVKIVQPVPKPLIANPKSVWAKVKPIETREILPIEKEDWNHMIVLSADVEQVDWKLVGNHLGKGLEKNEEFFLQPFSPSKAMFKVPNSAMREELLSKSAWNFNNITFKFSLWSSKINLISNEEVENINTSWILVSGVPFSLWNHKTFETIGSKCGGLLEIADETKFGWNLSYMKLKVRGPVEKSPIIVDVNFKTLLFRALIERSTDQSPIINNGLSRIKVCHPDSGTGISEGRAFKESDTSSTADAQASHVLGVRKGVHNPKNLTVLTDKSRTPTISGTPHLETAARPMNKDESIVGGQIKSIISSQRSMGFQFSPGKKNLMGQNEWAKAKVSGGFPKGFISSIATGSRKSFNSDSSSCSDSSPMSEGGSYLCGDSTNIGDDYTSDSSVERQRLFDRLNLEAAADSIGPCDGMEYCTNHCNMEMANSISNSDLQPHTLDSQPSSSEASQETPGNSPPFSPTGEYFMQALNDPEKEAL
ncbi:hypothetical protein MKW92_019215, partial [Papaver armeniacum]